MVTINGREVDVNPLADLLTEDNMKEMFLNKRSTSQMRLETCVRLLRLWITTISYPDCSLQSVLRTHAAGLEMNNLDEEVCGHEEQNEARLSAVA